MIDKKIIIRLKWGMEYVGTLVSYDGRMNVHLKDADEVIGGKIQEGHLNNVIIRCNNIMHIRQMPENYPTPDSVPGPDAVINEDE